VPDFGSTIQGQNQTSAALTVACRADAGFEAWLASSGGSIALTTYQAGKVGMLSWDGSRVGLLMRQFDKPLGLAVEGVRLALATRNEVTVFANAPLLAPDYLETAPGRYGALYLPRVTYHTGDLHAHDVVFHRGEVIIVNTQFSCLARVSAEYNFEPIWKPPFVTDLVPEDRCHLNGVAVVDGRLKYVTALARTDTAGGWRPQKVVGGVVVDVESGEVVLAGLCMPHSPRWHQGRLWLLNSGTGELLVWSPGQSQAETVCRLPGYLRGLCLVGRYALVGLSKIREKHIFGGLPIQKLFPQLLCAVVVVDTLGGGVCGVFEFTGGCEELYDVQFLPGIRRPMILNLDRPAARQAFTSPESSFWIRPRSEGQLPDGSGRESNTAPMAGMCADGAFREIPKSFDASTMVPKSGANI